MKRNSKKARPGKVIKLWSHEQAEKALPYLRSLMQSLRDTWVEARGHYLKSRKLGNKPGRPDRTALLEKDWTDQEAIRASDRLQEIVDELEAMDVYCFDPGRGQALIPFSHQDELAWFVFDLNAPKGLEGWRFHKDPLEIRRPMVEVTPPGATPPVAI